MDSVKYEGGGNGYIIGGVSNVNLIYPNALIPSLEYEIRPGVTEFESEICAKLAVKNIVIGKGECYGEA